MPTIKASGYESEDESLWNLKYILIALSTLFLLLGHNLLMPTFPLYVSMLGYSESIVGLIISLTSISALLIRPFVGRALDIFNRNKVYITGLLIFALSCLSYNFTTIIASIVMVRLIHGIGFGIATTASGTLAIDVLPKKHMVKGMIYYHLAPTIAMALAPAFGLYLIYKLNYAVLFYSSAMFIFIAAIITLFIKSNQIEVVQNKKKVSLFESSVLKPALIVFLSVTSFSSIMFYITMYASHQGIENIGVFFTVYALTIIISRPIAGLIVDRKGYDFVVIVSMFFFGASLILLAFASKLPLFILCAVMSGIGTGNIFPIMQVLALQNIAYERRGAATSTYFNSFDLGIILGSLLWGIVSQYAGYTVMYLLASIPVFTAIYFYTNGRIAK